MLHWTTTGRVREGAGMGCRRGARTQPGTPRPSPPHSALGPDVTALPRGHLGLGSSTPRPGAPSFLPLPPRFPRGLPTGILQTEVRLEDGVGLRKLHL